MTRETSKQHLNEKWFFVITGATLLLLFVWLPVKAKFDLNFMDEAFYLNWFKNAPDYLYSSTAFGFVYRPFYLLLEENILLLRYFNIVVNLFLGIILSYLVFTSFVTKLSPKLKITLLCISCSALLILIRQDVLLMSPSYNTLVFQGIVIFCIGIVSIRRNSLDLKLFNWPAAFIALGGWLVFLGKPTSAALLLAVFTVYIAFDKKNRKQVIFSSFVFSLLLIVLTSYLIDNGILRFINRYIFGVEIMKAYDAGYSTNLFDMFRLDLDTLVISNHQLTQLMVITVLVAGITKLFLSNHSYKFSRFINFLSYGLLLFSITVLLGLTSPMFMYYEFYMLVFPATVLGIWSGFFIAKYRIDSSTAGLSVLFFILPYVIAFGSGNSYWHLSLSASFFWVLSGFTLLLSTPRFTENNNALMFYGTLILLFSVISLWISGYFPQSRLEAHKNGKYTEYKVHGKYSIFLNKELADYFYRLTYQAKKMGFKSDDPVIDMSGQYGLSIYILDGKSVGMPMMYGGNPGSNKVASFSLDNVDCNVIAKSWLLIEPKGYRRLSSSIIERYGLSIEHDYYHSEMFRGLLYKGNPFKLGNIIYRKTNRQYLLKPKRNANEVAEMCNSYNSKSKAS